MIQVHIYDQALARSLRQYAAATNIDAEESIKEMARTGARQLAMRTEPFGLTGKAKTIGEMAVSKDVSLAYASTGRTYNALKAVSSRKARAYGAAIEAGDHAAAEAIVRRTLSGWDDVTATDSGQHLESLRGTNGRVSGTSIVNLTSEGAVSEIRREKMRTAGTAKAGWVQASQSIGATTRFPAWLRKSAVLGTSSILKRGWGTIVSLMNNVSYVRNVLPDGKLKAALRATEQNQLKRIRAILRNRARRY